MLDVIIPVYNAQDTVEQAVISAIQGEETRVILVDDGATDGSAAVCERLSRLPWVTVLHQPHRGVSAARNAGLAASKAEYVAFLDADDTLPLGSLPVLLEQLGDVDAIQGRVMKGGSLAPASEERQVLSARAALARALSDPTRHLHTHGWVFRRALLTEPFQPDLSLGEDGEWLLRTLLRAETVVFSKTPAYSYQVRPDSAVHGGTGLAERYLQTLAAAEPALEQAQLPREAALYRLTHLLLILTHETFLPNQPGGRAEALRRAEELCALPVFASAFEAADLSGLSARKWVLRLLKKRRLRLAYGAVRLRQRLNRRGAAT